MTPDRATDAYRSTAIEGAPPIAIVRLLYEGALRQLDRAAGCDPSDLRSPFAAALVRADSIVTELRLALAREPAPEIADGLEQLYLYVEERVRAALRERAREPIGEARAVLAGLHDAWSRLEVGTTERCG